MKKSRLLILMIVLAGLAIARWQVPMDESRSAAVVEAVVPTTAHRDAGVDTRTVGVNALIAAADDLSAGTRDAEDGPPRNAFVVRVPAAPLRPKIMPTVPAPRPFVGPPLQPPPPFPAPAPLPPLQVIGGWLDDRGMSVFLAGPRGVVQGRVGDLVMPEYRISLIGPQQVTLLHVPTNRIIPLAVSAGTLPPTALAR